MNATKIVTDMTNADYHAQPAFSSSQLKDMLRSAAHFYAHNISNEIEHKETESMSLGTLTHTLFLEPEKFDDEYIIMPKFDRRTKEGKAAYAEFEAQAAGKIIIDEEQHQAALGMAKNLKTLSIYGEMQKYDGLAEASIFFTDPTFNLDLRVRPDYFILPCDKYPNGLLIDLKTTDDARDKAFSSICGKFAYDLSAAMYRQGVQIAYETEDKPDFIFLVAERNAPFNVKQYKASDLFLATGELRYQQAKQSLAESLLMKRWAGYDLDLEDINLPAYISNAYLQQM